MSPGTTWTVAGLRVELALEAGPARLTGIRRGPDTPGILQHGGAGSGLVEILSVGNGTTHGRARAVATEIGTRLEWTQPREVALPGWSGLDIGQRDPVSGLSTVTRLRVADGAGALRAVTEVRNDGSEPVTLLAVTSLVHSGIGEFAAGGVGDLEVLWADSVWLAESRWRSAGWRDLVQPDVHTARHGQDPRGSFRLSSVGSWSSGVHLPMGGLRDARTGRVLLWQMEHNGSWQWELGETRAGGYLALSGPTDATGAWQLTLAPGETFTTVPVTIAVGSDLADAAGGLTAHRRASRRPHPDNAAMPLIFNDYMETLSGEPTTAALMPLVDAAAAVGAEVFCIDAGWYDDSGGGWWDEVGEWTPSTTRFPGGLDEVLDRIRDRGMVPGLWLEPEVVGVRSPVVDKLPDAAFLSRHGVRLEEQGRYFLDLRHPEARAHLDEVFDSLVGDHGVGYVKLDYNVDTGPGSDHDADSPGDGLLGHNRALLAYYGGLLDRYPGLVLENCASGGMRMDAATLAVLQLQSTTDQQNPMLRPPIAALAPLAMAPEQAANWVTPQPGMSGEELAFCVVTGLLGRPYLSGRLDLLDDTGRRLVAEGLAVHRSNRAFIRRARPLWPLGLPDWDAPWVCLGLADGSEILLAVWRRRGATAEVFVPLPAGAGAPEVLYPLGLDGLRSSWQTGPGGPTLRVGGGTVPAARLYRIRLGPPPEDVPQPDEISDEEQPVTAPTSGSQA